MLVVCFTAFFLIALYSQYLVSTGKSAENACGFIGEFFATTHFTLFGLISGFLAGLLAVFTERSFDAIFFIIFCYFGYVPNTIS